MYFEALFMDIMLRMKVRVPFHLRPIIPYLQHGIQLGMFRMHKEG